MIDVDLLSPRQLATHSGWPERRIRNLLAKGELQHIRMGSNYLLPRAAIEEFIARKMHTPFQREAGKEW